MARHAPNYVGGVSDYRQLFFRPVLRADPYAMPVVW